MAEEEYMLQLTKKLRLYPKSIPETVQKYSHQNLYAILCILPSFAEVIFLQLEHQATGSSAKHLSENVPDII